ncbi:RcnB family protein [Breoghania sp. JC706]|uniref:RcnB family protein n=1 Tax=Breoghania sp. JC706 TaxID=3117732 RepID=UPI00300AF746
MKTFKAILAAAVIGLSATVAAGPVLAGPQPIELHKHQYKGEGPAIQKKKPSKHRTEKKKRQSKKTYDSYKSYQNYKKHPSQVKKTYPKRRDDWMRRGGHMPRTYRNRPVDYRQHHLRKPPAGYHWVRHDDKYVLVAITSGIISSIINATR